eukprot:g20906.t1
MCRECHQLEELKLQVLEVEPLLMLLQCIRESKSYVDRTLLEVVTPQLKSVQVETDCYMNKEAQTEVQETLEYILLPNQYSNLNAGESDGSTGECCRSK